jgi:hypothetical protein
VLSPDGGGRACEDAGGEIGSLLVGGGVVVLGAPSKKRGLQLLGGSVLSQVVHHAVLPSGLVWQHLTVRSPKFSHLIKKIVGSTICPRSMVILSNSLRLVHMRQSSTIDEIANPTAIYTPSFYCAETKLAIWVYFLVVYCNNFVFAITFLASCKPPMSYH